MVPKPVKARNVYATIKLYGAGDTRYQTPLLLNVTFSRTPPFDILVGS